MRRTKIVATIGPASRDHERLRSMIDAGLDVARIGLAHGTLDQHLDTYRRVRAAAADAGNDIGVLVDLPGPKVRCAEFQEGGVVLGDGQPITVRAGTDGSNAEVIEVDYERVAQDVMIGDQLALGDGNITLVVSDKDGDDVAAHIVHGGLAQGRPGFQIPSNRLRLSTPTSEDLRCTDAFLAEGVDYLAVSFVRSAHDIRSLDVPAAPEGPVVVAKIETRAAVENLEAIVETSGAVMVARGDLGLDFPISELPHLQKHIIRRCIARSRPVITATQMLESMVHSPTPTRAEATDVANAVFDGTSAVMLSGETAVGDDPVNAVATMARITARADEEFDHRPWKESIDQLNSEELYVDRAAVQTNALGLAACQIAETVGANAIICLSRSGFTVRSVARFRPDAKILAFGPDERTIRQLRLSWGTHAALTPERETTREVVEDALQAARDRKQVESGDPVLVISGQTTKARATDTLGVVTVP